MLETERRKITIEDLLRLRFVSDPQMSPDGAMVVFVVKVIDAEKNKYFSHLWLVRTDGGDARQFTYGEVSDGNPRWSPDGKGIAFLRTRDKQTQIHLIPADGGEARAVTKLEQGGISNLAWSPEGTRIAFVYSKTPEEWTEKAAEERRKNNRSTPPRIITRIRYRLDGAGFLGERHHIWVVDIPPLTPPWQGGEGAEARQITDGDYDDHSLCWSPDGQTIAFFSNRSPDPDETPWEMDLWLVPAAGGELRKVPTPRGYKGNTAWSPDGKLIAYEGIESQEDPWVTRNARVWAVSVDGGEVKNLTASLDRTVGNSTLSDTREAFAGGSAPIWSADSRRLFFIVSDCGSAHFYTVSVSGGEPVALTHGALDLSGYSADQEARRLALLIGSATEPGDIYTLTIDDPPPTQRAGAEAPPPATHRLTDLHRSFLAEVALAQPEEIWVDSFDGTRVQGWILKPPDFDATQRYPLILYIHGGPHAQYGNALFHEFQVLAASGYVVLYTNPRGSRGYAENFAAAIRGDWGNLDYRDLLAGVDYALTLGYVDERRLGVAGGSYGGYMTNWIVGRTDRFACAITDRSVVNLVSMAGTSDFVMHRYGYWHANTWDDPAVFISHSPLTHAADIKTPLLIIHSEGDLRCPISQAEELFSALKSLKREAVFIRYPQETSHGMSRGGPPDLRVHRLQQNLAWFDKYLKPNES